MPPEFHKCRYPGSEAAAHLITASCQALYVFFKKFLYSPQGLYSIVTLTLRWRADVDAGTGSQKPKPGSILKLIGPPRNPTASRWGFVFTHHPWQPGKKIDTFPHPYLMRSSLDYVAFRPAAF